MEAFREKFISKTSDLSEIFPIIKARNAYMAGGCFASILTNNPVKDYDIFVNIKQSLCLIFSLLDHGFKISSKSYGGLYDKYGNGKIHARFVLHEEDIELDIIVIYDEPLDYISNFDMTCCQVWFDGEILNGNDMDSFFDKIGYYNPDKCNAESCERFDKYTAKGFAIRKLPQKEPEVPAQDLTIMNRAATYFKSWF